MTQKSHDRLVQITSCWPLKHVFFGWHTFNFFLGTADPNLHAVTPAMNPDPETVTVVPPAEMPVDG